MLVRGVVKNLIICDWPHVKVATGGGKADESAIVSLRKKERRCVLISAWREIVVREDSCRPRSASPPALIAQGWDAMSCCTYQRPRQACAKSRAVSDSGAATACQFVGTTRRQRADVSASAGSMRLARNGSIASRSDNSIVSPFVAMRFASR